LKTFNIIAAVAGLLLILGAGIPFAAASGSGVPNAGPGAVAREAEADGAKCFACHGEVRDLFAGSKHSHLECTACHSSLDSHLTNRGKLVTSMDPALCGSCHRDQYDTLYKVNPKSKARVEKGVPDGRAPLLDKLLAGHGFTRQHDEPRSHAFMLLDHVADDRAYGGRFRLRSWGLIDRFGRLWDMLEDTGRELPESVKAATPTCITCKSNDQILSWAHMGDKNPAAKWDRTSPPNEFVKAVQNPMGCIQCHDPHATKPRIVRDALVEAMERDAPGGKKGWAKVVTFRGFRKIAILPAYDSMLACAQCHVEYNCNAGHDPETGEKIGLDDRRANHFPMKSVFEIRAHYDTLKFRDFKHAFTGASLIKAQHPEAEVFRGSVHEKAGLGCGDCHMPKMKNTEGKTFTSHWQTSPRNYLAETCGNCHGEWTPQEMEYRIDAMQSYVKGKIRKAEFWLSKLIDEIELAQRAGVSEDVLKEARRCHDTAHILWEWWTAENSDGFHNPDQAREALAQSVVASKKGIGIIESAWVSHNRAIRRPSHRRHSMTL
jgi:predicted CXXCH cytochrome family protein